MGRHNGGRDNDDDGGGEGVHDRAITKHTSSQPYCLSDKRYPPRTARTCLSVWRPLCPCLRVVRCWCKEGENTYSPGAGLCAGPLGLLG